MRIIINAISANTGGIVTYTSNLIELISRENTKATVYVPRTFNVKQFNNPNVVVKKVPVKRFFGPVHRFIWEQFFWRKIVKDSGAEILYSSANYGILFPPIEQVLLVQGEIYLNPVYREKVLPKLPIGERFSAFLRRNLMLLSARHSIATIFPSKIALQAALDYDPNIATTSFVNYLGVGNRFTVTNKQRFWRQGGQLQLLYVSVFYPHKDPVTLAEATRLLNNKGLKTKTLITMESSDFDPWPSSNHELMELQSERYADCVSIGRIEHHQLTKALRSYDAFVFPSMAETFGFPMVEAMRSGIPLIVSDIPIHHEICGDTALYFELSNPKDLAKRIMELDENPGLRESLTLRAKKRAVNLFSWENHINSLHKIFFSIVEPKPTRVLINALHARTGGGVTYLRNMLPLLAKDPMLKVHLCANRDQQDILPKNIKNINYHFLDFERGLWKTLIREQFELPKLALHIKADLTFSPANYGPIFAPNTIIMLRNAVSVGFVERRFIKLGYWVLLSLATLVSLIACRRAIAVSNYASHVGSGFLWGLLKSKVTVIPHGVDKRFCVDKDVVRDPNTLLAVSDIYVQKNFKNLLFALSDLIPNYPNIHLKIAGRPIDLEYLQELDKIV
jgi:glycosyltransferase involved in cell wall biosynthesis